MTFVYPEKTTALALLATFLISIPLAFVDNNLGLTRAVYELKVDANFAKPTWHTWSKVEPYFELVAQGPMTIPANPYFEPSDEDSGFDAAIAESIGTYKTYAGNLFQDPVEESGLAGGIRDYKNALLFDYLGNTNTIAVTYAWITRGRTKLIVEFDVIFNTHYDWGNAAQNTQVMDTWNIITHEMGHCVGLGDLYQVQNAEQTMYGYATEGETDKRTLETGDIAGLAALYGS